MSYGTEAGIFQNAGIPSVVIGPGDAADAHQPDESIACDELEPLRRLSHQGRRDLSLNRRSRIDSIVPVAS